MELSEIRDMIRATMPVEVTDVTDTYLDRLINQCIHEVSLADQWRWLEAVSTITTIADTDEYALPNDFNFGLAIVNTDEHETVMPISPATYFHMYGDDTDSERDALHFTVFNGNIILAPVPSEAGTDKYNLYYYKTPTELSADDDEPEWQQAFHWLIVDWVASKLYRREAQMDQAVLHMAEYNASLEEMRRWYRRTFEETRPIFGDGVVLGQRNRNLPGFTFG